MSVANAARFPTAAGLLFGLGLGGFFDGIVLHQMLQWHHMMTSAGYPPASVANLEFNTLLDGLFHVATYVFIVAGLLLLWRGAQQGQLLWSGDACRHPAYGVRHLQRRRRIGRSSAARPPSRQ